MGHAFVCPSACVAHLCPCHLHHLQQVLWSDDPLPDLVGHNLEVAEAAHNLNQVAGNHAQMVVDTLVVGTLPVRIQEEDTLLLDIHSLEVVALGADSYCLEEDTQSLQAAIHMWSLVEVGIHSLADMRVEAVRYSAAGNTDLGEDHNRCEQEDTHTVACNTHRILSRTVGHTGCAQRSPAA